MGTSPSFGEAGSLGDASAPGSPHSKRGVPAWFTLSAAALLLVACGMLTRRGSVPAPARSQGYRFRAGDDRAPTDPRYLAAVQQGRAGDLKGAERELLQLVGQTRGSSTAAWSLYQVGLAARKRGDGAAKVAAWRSLSAEYAEHPLTRRVTPQPKAAPPVKHGEDAMCGPRCLEHVLQLAGKSTPAEALAKECQTTEEGTSLEALQTAAQKHGLKAEGVQAELSFLRQQRPQGIAWVSGRHYVYFQPGEGDTARVWDPDGGMERTERWESLLRRSQGVLLLLAWGDRRLPRL